MSRNSDIDRLRGLFAKRLIATMDMLKKTVGTVADLTVFRKLRELDYCTSYSHRGRFYTLRELAEFDENGLWWIRSVGFSSRGTLVATAEGLVNASEAGYAVEELDAIVRVGTKDVLPKLAWEKRLRRTRIRNRNVYFSPKRSIREQQIASRRVWEAQPSVSKSIAAQDVLPDERFPGRKHLLVVADTGGSNGATRRAWKHGIQHKLCNEHGLDVTVAHYPPGASKWNPIEHRLFSEISKNWAGRPLDSYETILNFIRTTKTKTGLKVNARLVKKQYPKGIKISDPAMALLNIKKSSSLPKWNYTLRPSKNGK